MYVYKNTEEIDDCSLETVEELWVDSQELLLSTHKINTTH